MNRKANALAGTIPAFGFLVASVAMLLVLLPQVARAQAPQGEEDLIRMFEQNRPYSIVSPELFNQLGWDLPDGGATVKALADAAPGGAFDPRKLESLPADKLGYRAKWHEVRYNVYGIPWEIGGLHLTPNNPTPASRMRPRTSPRS